MSESLREATDKGKIPMTMALKLLGKSAEEQDELVPKIIEAVRFLRKCGVIP